MVNDVSAPLYRNGVSALGAAIVTLSAVGFLAVFLLDLFGLHANPYVGIVFFLIAPAIFILGLLLIPLGMLLERRRRAGGRPPRHWPKLDLNDPRQRQVVFIVLVLTLANALIVSLAAYRGVEFMDSVAFCGTACHEVMEPQHAAYDDGPHSRVRCVQCHIGPGAPWFVRSKLDGARQVVAVALDTYSRPIPNPVHNLRPARDTCEQCHWPEKFHGDKIEARRDYASDEASTETVTMLRIHVGGGSDRFGVPTGIHWHMSIANEIEYIATDEHRMEIPYVRLRTSTGEVREYYAPGVTPEQLQSGERRTMDCVDCHNRPAHRFLPTPERAVDAALSTGELPRDLPYVRREAVAALSTGYPDRTVALQEIATRLSAFYAAEYPEVERQRRGEVNRAIEAVQRIYSRNVFPRMNVGWGTYPDHIGHTESPGCFRCHNDEHRTATGRVISQDCTLCHTFE